MFGFRRADASVKPRLAQQRRQIVVELGGRQKRAEPMQHLHVASLRQHRQQEQHERTLPNASM